MSFMNRHYLLLAVFLVGGLAGTVFSAVGGDQFYGIFGSGLASGTVLAFYVLRRVESKVLRSVVVPLEASEPNREDDEEEQAEEEPVVDESVPSASIDAPERMDPPASFTTMSVEMPDERPVESPRLEMPGTDASKIEAQMPEPVADPEPPTPLPGVELAVLDGEVPPVQADDEPSQQHEDVSDDGPIAAEPGAEQSLERCSCVCGCEKRSISGELGLCGNCSRWWLQQSEKCECDYTVTEFCECGVIQHGQSA